MYCDKYCTHGGRCIKEINHTDIHDTEFCLFNDDETLTKEEADTILDTKLNSNPDLAQFLKNWT